MRFEYYGTATGWYWRLVARNSKTIADGAEAYTSKANVKRAVQRLRSALYQRDIPIVEV